MSRYLGDCLLKIKSWYASGIISTKHLYIKKSRVIKRQNERLKQTGKINRTTRYFSLLDFWHTTELKGTTTAATTKTSPENISLFHLCYFAIISTRSTFTKMANYPGTKLVGVAYKVRKKILRSRSPQNLKCGHFTLLFCRGRQRNVPKYRTHMQSDCFCSLNLFFCGVVVAVAVNIA